MDIQIYFNESEGSYRFSKLGDDEQAFIINKSDLVFDTKVFYELFFKGLTEKPRYTVIDSHTEEPGHRLTSQAKHIFDTVSKVFSKACDGIQEDWFEDKQRQGDGASIPAEKDVPTSNN